MRAISLSNIGDTFHVVRDPTLFKNAVTTGNQVYINSDETAVACYIRLNQHTCEAHVESTRDCRGKELKQFLIQSGIACFKEDDRVLSIINFVDKKDRALQLFISTISDRGCEVNNKIMYVSERDTYLEV